MCLATFYLSVVAILYRCRVVDTKKSFEEKVDRGSDGEIIRAAVEAFDNKMILPPSICCVVWARRRLGRLGKVGFGCLGHLNFRLMKTGGYRAVKSRI